jgi:hypothetical protein
VIKQEKQIRFFSFLDYSSKILSSVKTINNIEFGQNETWHNMDEKYKYGLNITQHHNFLVLKISEIWNTVLHLILIHPKMH